MKKSQNTFHLLLIFSIFILVSCSKSEKNAYEESTVTSKQLLSADTVYVNNDEEAIEIRFDVSSIRFSDIGSKDFKMFLTTEIENNDTVSVLHIRKNPDITTASNTTTLTVATDSSIFQYYLSDYPGNDQNQRKRPSQYAADLSSGNVLVSANQTGPFEVAHDRTLTLISNIKLDSAVASNNSNIGCKLLKDDIVVVKSKGEFTGTESIILYPSGGSATIFNFSYNVQPKAYLIKVL